MNIDALTAYLALSSGSYSGILRDMYAVYNLGLNPDLHTKLLANRFVGGTKELSGIPPLSFKSKGKPLTAWSITGNTVQNGTPTPENPVEVQAVGDRTGNLFDYKKYFESTFTKYSEYFEWAEIQLKPFTTYTFTTSFSESTVSGVVNTAFIIATSTEEPRTVTGGISSTRICTKTTEQDGIIKIYKRIKGRILPKKEDFDSGMHWLMINEGDTALSYEPYGYKIPVVTSADGTEPITTPIYLPTPLYSGEVMRSDGTITRSDGTTETFTAPQIPTINGTTVIDVDTAVKPESMTIKYRR